MHFPSKMQRNQAQEFVMSMLKNVFFPLEFGLSRRSKWQNHYGFQI